MRKLQKLPFIAAALVCVLPTVHASDSFAGAPLVPNNSTVTANNATATTEAGERINADPNSTNAKTMWYRYVAPARGMVRITTPTSPAIGFSHNVQVFRGDSLSALNLVTYERSILSTSSVNFQFPAEAGMEFRIVFAMRSSSSLSGAFSFTVQQEAWPYGSVSAPLVIPEMPTTSLIPNDEIGQAQVITASASPVSVLGYSYDATQTNLGPEPGITGHRTLWYRWIAPQRGIAVIATPASPVLPFRNNLSVFRGNELTALNIVQNGDTGTSERQISLSFPVEAGMEYKIAFGGRSSNIIDAGPFVFTVRTDAWPYGAFPVVAPRLPVSSVPQNDQFDGATAIPSALGKVTIFDYNQSATTASSSFEPSKIGYRSLWYKWTASENAVVTIQTPSAPSVGFAHSLITHTGPSYDGLSQLPTGAGSIVVDSTTAGGISQFFATKGTTYFLSFTAARSSAFGSVAFSFDAIRDQTKPILAVTGKIPKATIAKSILIKGTASDQGGIARVQYRVGSGAPKTASGTTAWQINAKLKKGQNTITLFATDLSGNVSLNKVIKIKRK
jgi:Bacterial Ig domain